MKLALLLFAIPAFAQVQASVNQLGASDIWAATFDWTADGTGAVAVSNAPVGNNLQGFTIGSIDIAQGVILPTSGYSITITNGYGVDCFAGATTGLTITGPQSFAASGNCSPLNGTLTFRLTANAVAGAKGKVAVYLQKPGGLVVKNVTVSPSQASTGSGIAANAYNFTRSPSGTLTGATPATVTIAPVPLGLNGSNTNYYVYLTNCSGGAQAVLVTGGSAVSGAATGTLTFTPTNSCNAGYTMVSASSGVQESWIVARATGTSVTCPAGTIYHVYAPIYYDATSNHPLKFVGDGYAAQNVNRGCILLNDGTGNIFTILSDNLETEIYFAHMALIGTASSGKGILCTNCTGLRMEYVFQNTSGDEGLRCVNCFGTQIDKSVFDNNSAHGLVFTNAANAVKITNSEIGGNCRAIVSTCFGVLVQTGKQVTLRDNIIEGNGYAPLSAYAPGAYGIGATNVTALTIAGNHFETNLTQAVYLGSGVTGFDINASEFEDSGIHLDTATNGSVRNNSFAVYANVAKSISGVVDNGAGACRYTVSSAINLTPGAFVLVAAAGGVTACNGPAIVTASSSATVFDTNLAFSGAYTSGGTAIQATGLRAVATGFSNIQVTGNDFTQSTALITGADLLPGTGADLASGALITPTNRFHRVTGTGAIDMIAVPSGFGDQFCAFPTGAFTWTAAGNILAVGTATVGKQVCFAYNQTTSKWYASQ